jgi:[acyl-carrier-protein] S-malonyltransferase
MSPASERLAALLDAMPLRQPVVPLINNADALLLDDAGKIKDSLVRQLGSPLLWEDSIQNMAASGVDIFVEAGPGKVLSGLIKRIVPDKKVLNVEDTKSLEAALSSL